MRNKLFSTDRPLQPRCVCQNAQKHASLTPY